jgi:lipoprotein LprG
LPAEEIVAKTADRLNELSGFHFVIDRDGAPAFLDPDNTLSFSFTEGDYVAPDKSQAVVRVIAPGLVTEVNVVSIDKIQWQTNVLTGAWEELPPNWGFNPAVLFDAAIGLPAILQNDLTDLQFVDSEQLEDGPDVYLYKLTAVASGESLYQMSGTLIGPETVTAEFWIMPETFELIRVIITEPEPERDEPSIWQVDFSQFNHVIEIVPPIGD